MAKIVVFLNLTLDGVMLAKPNGQSIYRGLEQQPEICRFDDVEGAITLDEFDTAQGQRSESCRET